MVKNKKGFTLVELLAVIVILAVILVIAVPQIMNVITESRKGALASSAKLIASSAETAYISNQTLGIEKDIECKDISNYTAEDYKSCKIEFVDGKAQVLLVGQGKFEGMCVSRATKEDAEVEELISGECPTAFKKDSWSTIKAAVRSGDTSKYRVGDTKTVELGSLGTHTVRIANKSNDWEHCGEDGYSQTACGFVIEFADVISKHPMKSTDTNAGGWKDSAMRTYVNETIYDALVAAIGDTNKTMIIDTTVVSGHGSGDTNNFESEDKLYLLSPEEVYGTSLTSSYDTSRETSRQLDWYSTNGVTISNYSNAIKKNSSNSAIYWWLRSAKSTNTTSFSAVIDYGCCGLNFYTATNTNGVSPAFRLG